VKERAMLGTIIRKEILNSVISFRFVAVFALLLILVPVTVFILTNDYVKKVEEFSSRRQGIEDYLKAYAHFNRLGGVVQPSQPPLPATALVRGISFDINLEDFDDDPLPVMFPLLDLVFVVAILLSLAALIFSYDAVSGEKEDGTLKLMLANGLPRHQILLGKIFGGTLTLFIPFLVSMVLGLIVILMNPRISWTGANWGSLGLVLGGAAVYVFFFESLGVLISSRHHSSSASIMTSLCVWVLLVLVIPNLSPYLASLLSPAPSRIKVNREISRLTDVERDNLGRQLQAEKMRDLVKRYPVLISLLSEAETKTRAEKDPAFREAVEARTREVQAAWEEANRIQGEKVQVLRAELDRREAAQTRLARIVSMISPLADFSYWATDLTSTGLRNIAHFNDLSDRWGRAYGEYSRSKIAALQKQDPTVDWWNTAVDVSDMPRFEYSEETLAARFRSALGPLAVLLVMSVGIFGAAFVSFVRTDPR
jgi:ABC-type transport system involved in multi-copper enzyme maturation permease subunit